MYFDVGSCMVKVSTNIVVCYYTCYAMRCMRARRQAATHACIYSILYKWKGAFTAAVNSEKQPWGAVNSPSTVIGLYTARRPCLQLSRLLQCIGRNDYVCIWC